MDDAATKAWREAQHIAGSIAESVDQEIWDAPHGRLPLYGFEPEDPTLTGRPEDGDDGGPIVLVRKEDGARFSVEVEIWCNALPALEDDPDYVDPNKVEPASVDPNQTSLL